MFESASARELWQQEADRIAARMKSVTPARSPPPSHSPAAAASLSPAPSQHHPHVSPKHSPTPTAHSPAPTAHAHSPATHAHEAHAHEGHTHSHETHTHPPTHTHAAHSPAHSPSPTPAAATAPRSASLAVKKESTRSLSPKVAASTSHPSPARSGSHVTLSPVPGRRVASSRSAHSAHSVRLCLRLTYLYIDISLHMCVCVCVHLGWFIFQQAGEEDVISIVEDGGDVSYIVLLCILCIMIA